MNSSPPLSRVIEQPSTPESQSFDYAVLNTETRIVVQQRTSEIKTLMRQTAKDTISIGQKLTEVKQQLGHGEFGKWLKAEFNWGITTAWKLMKVAEVFKFLKRRGQKLLNALLLEKPLPTPRLSQLLLGTKTQPNPRAIRQ
jgi:hypothetical protein